MRELLLISVSGIQYGIWKDEILSVEDARAIHRLPLSPACIAGISIVDGRTVTLADLPVCIGHELSPGTGQGRILLMEGEKVMGFVISGEMRTLSLPPELLFPLPEYLKTPLFGSCAILDNIPIPLINIAELLSRVLKADQEPFAAPLLIPAAESRDISGTTGIRFFAAGEELYAASAAGMDDKAIKPGPITPIPNTPQYVKGVTFSEGRLLPVIDLSQRIKRQSGAPEPLMLTAGIGGAAFGLLIDDDGGAFSADEVTIKPTPMIARSSWLKDVVVREGELIPLIDLAVALSPGAGTGDEKPLWQRYTPDSGFPALFAKQEVEVVEFSLLGVRHALPKEEVEDVIAFKPCRELPDAPDIVIGVALHQGEVLPVVDLAMMFNRRSLSTPGWRMMLVKNGDFRALVMTEAVFGERRLSLELQRAVPILLPHHLVYGCYPDADAVRLILNVEAMAVYFEKSLIKKFLPALSQEMRRSPAEIVHALLEEKIGEEPHVPATVTPARAEEGPVPAAASAAALSPAGPEDLAKQEQASGPQEVHEPAPELQKQAGEESVELIQAQEAVSATPAIIGVPEQMDVPPEEPLAGTQEALSPAGERSDGEALEQERVPPAISPGPEQTAVDRIAAPIAGTQESLSIAGEGSAGEALEQGRVPPPEAVAEKTTETITSSAEPSDLAAPVQVSAQEPSGEGSKAPEPVDINERRPGEGVTAPARNDQEAASSQAALEQELVKTRSEGLSTSGAAVVPASDDSRPSEPIRVEESAKSGASYQRDRKKEQLAVPPGTEEPADDTAWKRGIVYAAIGAALVAVLYFAWTSHEPGVEKSAKETGPAMIEQGKPKTVPPLPAEKPRAPLVLEIPASRPVDIEVYVVKEGDTLWDISKRFTGNPFNYPRIAGENRIADPDLIFPGQRIRLKKK